MKRRSLSPLGETEMEVLNHVWTLGEATVAAVRDRILEERDIAYTTVMTVMKKLAGKGFLRFDSDGGTYVYGAARPPGEVRQEILEGLLDSVFQGSRTALVQTLVQGQAITGAEREELLALVETLAGEGGGTDG
ncbi:MAG: BlaI/MecI/CopY family transcriptional regulator [Gemmatimonadota bacterium]|nr:BlaI/MecI/CopY family transcriptional regulator [Gemmatimonadota bacterium]